MPSSRHVQRREIIGTSSVFVDQAPVRAAVHGRLLVLDGMENAERNVLPTLNSLLENREMALDDGRFLLKRETLDAIRRGGAEGASAPAGALAGAGDAVVAMEKLVPVHPEFRVIALSCPVPPYPGRTIDPPLRSRFQCRYVDELATSTVLNNISDIGSGSAGGERSGSAHALDTLRRLAQFYEGLSTLRTNIAAGVGGAGGGSGGGGSALSGLPQFSLADLQYCHTLSCRHPHVPLQHIVNTVAPVLFPGVASVAGSGGISAARLPPSLHSLLPPKHVEAMGHIVSSLGLSSSRTTMDADAGAEAVANGEAGSAAGSGGSRLLAAQRDVLTSMLAAQDAGRHICLLGTKVSAVPCCVAPCVLS